MNSRLEGEFIIIVIGIVMNKQRHRIFNTGVQRRFAYCNISQIMKITELCFLDDLQG